MRAMILGAGKGTRVRPLTERVPKPMIPLLGKPVMEYLVDVLRGAGVDGIMTNLCHLGEVVEAYFGDGHRFGVDMVYSWEQELLGSGGGLKRVEDFFRGGTFLVVCGDALVDLDLAAAVATHRRRGALATLVLTKTATPECYGIVELDPDERIVSFQEKPRREEARTDLANTGIYIFEPEILDIIPAGRAYDLGGDLFPELVRRGAPFFGHPARFEWLDMGTLADYYRVTRDCLEGRVSCVPPRGKVVGDRVWAGTYTRIHETASVAGPVMFGTGCSVGAGAEIVGPCYVGPGCVIDPGARVVRSVVLPYTRVGAGVTLQDCIVDREYVIDAARAAHVRLETGDRMIVGDSRLGPAPGPTARTLMMGAA